NLFEPAAIGRRELQSTFTDLNQPAVALKGRLFYRPLAEQLEPRMGDEHFVFRFADLAQHAAHSDLAQPHRLDAQPDRSELIERAGPGLDRFRGWFGAAFTADGGPQKNNEPKENEEVCSHGDVQS